MSATATVVPHWIAGAADESAARWGEVTDSATGEVSARVPLASAADVDRAVRAAAEAARGWAATSLSRRTAVMFAFRQLVHEHRDELARIVTREHGKVLSDAAGEVQRGLEVVDFACGIAHLLKGEMTPQVSGGIDSYSLRQPLGVMAGITPFNFPVMVPMWMFPIAIAAGNAFVLKPSEQDPSASLLLARLFAQAGLPEGVLTVVNGDREAVNALLSHPQIAGVSFVGSTPIARHVYETASAHGKRVQALGGAKNHAVVLPDADLDLAADGLVSAAYGSAGQRCMAVSVAVAVGDVGDRLVEAVRTRLEDLTTGPGTDPASQMGPLVSSAHRARVAELVDSGEAEGAQVLVDGRGLTVDGHDGGHWLGPTLLDRVRPGMRVYDEEIFGPVLVVVRAESYPEALQLVNANPYGNGAAIFTRDGGAARQFEQDVVAGMVGVNVPIPVPMAYHSFGGWKHSLFGDLHVHGPDGVRFNTRGKVVTRRWPNPADRGIDLGFPVLS
ncbi:CoA-acylating methylmalonate-semialdehyde dehydrogenase [Conexibacter woesei]|uniref:methylmalonate-semialdehyde dehydrogenase (CoA acylating) n=1 Tax=Conexibacter woesei (strain DSM 14684 / CCUG 47730 / CIP 108061 / JCM 11494 / NBRC 100937 / ID131577) TaxID=469383 RepID=D3EZL8_CONWI|nr:CoA-acylating methylmalonate-semialdehyde dehydrogenase [Conexibacter woesei]ADB53856.1 methylmalonate-semialdehyde dehydrogenase [Conexibacter woesei DSM 14684]